MHFNGYDVELGEVVAYGWVPESGKTSGVNPRGTISIHYESKSFAFPGSSHTYKRLCEAMEERLKQDEIERTQDR